MHRSTDTAPESNRRLSIAAVVRAPEIAWHPSPSPSVFRKTFYRHGGETGPVTSLVRYEPDSVFPSHTHSEGEEILVLDGVFSDENGDYPSGTFLLNPPGTSHRPFSRQGCVLFVHLRQYEGESRIQRVQRTTLFDMQPDQVCGACSQILYRQSPYPEMVSIESRGPKTEWDLRLHDGIVEIFVLRGDLSDWRGSYSAYTWLRMPKGKTEWRLHSTDGCVFYLRRWGNSKAPGVVPKMSATASP